VLSHLGSNRDDEWFLDIVSVVVVFASLVVMFVFAVVAVGIMFAVAGVSFVAIFVCAQ
jgi:hypothetical protein